MAKNKRREHRYNRLNIHKYGDWLDLSLFRFYWYFIFSQAKTTKPV